MSLQERSIRNAALAETGGPTTPERAAFDNAALIRYLDFMDTFVSPGEACHPADNIARILAAAELAGDSGAAGGAISCKQAGEVLRLCRKQTSHR